MASRAPVRKVKAIGKWTNAGCLGWLDGVSLSGVGGLRSLPWHCEVSRQLHGNTQLWVSSVTVEEIDCVAMMYVSDAIEDYLKERGLPIYHHGAGCGFRGDPTECVTLSC